MKEENLEALWANMHILITGLDACHVLTHSTERFFFGYFLGLNLLIFFVNYFLFTK